MIEEAKQQSTNLKCFLAAHRTTLLEAIKGTETTVRELNPSYIGRVQEAKDHLVKLKENLKGVDTILGGGLDSMKRTHMIMGALAMSKHDHPKVADNLPETTVELAIAVVDQSILGAKPIQVPR